MTESVAVFLSYASQDAEAAQRICDALKAAGIEVWFDKSELRGGDVWDHKIRQQIRDCALFIPVISTNTASRHEGYFRMEWDLADQRTHMISRDRVFIVPVCIDGTSDSSTDVPESFARVQWTRLRNGQPPTAFSDRVSRLVTERRSANRASPTDSESSNPPIVAHENSAQEVAAIAVLPFTDMSPDRDQDHLCEGIAEELIDARTQGARLRVAARSSSFQFREAGLNVCEAGRQLRVGSLLQGSVRKSGDRLRITVQLVEVTSGYHKWSERFERKVGDVFAIQDEIAAAVSTVLRGNTSALDRPAARWRPTDMGTYEYFLRGRQYMHRMQQPYMDQSRDMFERAIALDERYAPAWAGLATVRALMYEWWGSKDEDLVEADRASRVAMELAPELADAHVARGFSLSLYRRYEEARHCYETATRLNPNLFDAYYYHGRAAFAYGDIERSVELFRRASEVRQEDFQSPMLQAQSLRRLGRSDEAEAVNRDGIARAERVLALNPEDGRALSLGSGALQLDGQDERAFEWARRAERLFPDDMGVLFNGACLRARAGLKTEAIGLLERVIGKGWGKRDWIEHDQDYNSLRDEPRFQAMMANLK